MFEFISPLESITTFDRRQVRFILNKYKYIELLCIKFEIGPFQNAENCVKKIVDCLAELEQYCPSKEDYNGFCLLLTLENFDQHPDYKNWNPSKSRIKCFNEVKRYIEKFLPIIRRPAVRPATSAKGDRLVQIIIKGLLYDACREYCQRRAVSVDARVQFEFAELLEEASNRSDSSLLAWLQSVPAGTFGLQFEDKKLNVNIEKLDKPSLMANWSEMMLSSPIKPKVFPHSATPFTRLRATDLMSKSLTSGIVDGLSKSIMSFSLKDAADMSHSSFAAGEFHLGQRSGPMTNTTSNVTGNVTESTTASMANMTPNLKTTSPPNKPHDSFRTPGKDEQMMEKMFEQGNVFNSSCLGKLTTISEDRALSSRAEQARYAEQARHAEQARNAELARNVELSSQNKENLLSGGWAPTDQLNAADIRPAKGDDTSIEEMKMQLEQFADAQWKEFLRKKDEIMLSSVTKATMTDRTTADGTAADRTMSDRTPNRFNGSASLTPVGQTGQKFVDLQSLITSTPKATPKDDGRLHELVVDYHPVRLNFSGISADSSATTVVSADADYQNQTARLASNDFDLNTPKSRHFANLSNQFNVSTFSIFLDFF